MDVGARESWEDFNGRVAIVTGGGAGLGKAYAHWLAARGCAVVVNSRIGPDGTSRAQQTVDEIVAVGGRATAYKGRADEPSAGEAMVAAAEAAFGPPDILICNAGIIHWGELGSQSPEQLREVVDVNIWSTVYPLQGVWPGMLARGYGRVVMTSSPAGLWGMPQAAGYSLAKAAVVGLARGMTVDTPPGADIRLNVVVPVAYTAMSDTVVPPEWADYLSVDRVAPVVGWLCGSACRKSGLIYHVGAGRVRRASVIEGPVGLLAQESLGELMPALEAEEGEFGSSSASSAELMPEMIAARTAAKAKRG